MSDRPTAEELASYTWGGQRARPRKGIEGVTKHDAVYVKPPGSLLTRYPGLGIAIDVECCEGCSIYILDASERVQISECVNCRIVVGPCVGSIMLFECKGCTMTVASKQVRLRDCEDCDLRVYAAAHECVVIETSKKLRIGGWDVAYPGLAEQFASTGWWKPDVGYKNHSGAIFDFSPPPGGGKNWAPLSADSKGRWCELSVVSTEGLTGGQVTEVRVDMPTTHGVECPCAAPDGTQYEASWFSSSTNTATLAASALAASATAAAAAEPEAKRSAIGAPSTAPNAPSTTPSSAADDAPPKRGLLTRLFRWLTGKTDKEPSSVGLADVKVKGGNETQVCVIS